LESNGNNKVRDIMISNPVYVVYPSNQWNSATHGARVDLLRKIGLNRQFMSKYSKLGWDLLHPAIQQRITMFYGREQNPLRRDTTYYTSCPFCGSRDYHEEYGELICDRCGKGFDPPEPRPQPREQNPTTPNLDLPYMIGTVRKILESGYLNEAQKKYNVVIWWLSVYPVLHTKEVDEELEKLEKDMYEARKKLNVLKIEKNPLTRQEIDELASQRDAYMDELTLLESKQMNRKELDQHIRLLEKVKTINDIINTYDGSLNTPEEMGKWVSHKVDEQNPFKSEAQRRYLWMHHPDIARRWTKKYGSKVVTEQNPQVSQQVLDEIKEAHRKIVEWENSRFDLGTPFQHCSQLESYAGPALKEALKAGLVRIDMPSEYHAPRFVVKGTEQNPRKSLQYYDITYAGVPRTRAGLERFIRAACMAGYSMGEINDYLKTEQNPLTAPGTHADFLYRLIRAINDCKEKDRSVYIYVDDLYDQYFSDMPVEQYKSTMERLYRENLIKLDMGCPIGRDMKFMLQPRPGLTRTTFTGFGSPSEMNPMKPKIEQPIIAKLTIPLRAWLAGGGDIRQYTIPAGEIISYYEIDLLPSHDTTKITWNNTVYFVYPNEIRVAKAEHNPLTKHDFKEALEGEGWAIGDYKDMISKTDSPNEQETLKHIMKEEQEHQDELINLMQCSYPPEYEENHTPEQVAKIGLVKAAEEDLTKAEMACRIGDKETLIKKLNEVLGYMRSMSYADRVVASKLLGWRFSVLSTNARKLDTGYESNYTRIDRNFEHWLKRHGYTNEKFQKEDESTRNILESQYTFETGLSIERWEGNSCQTWGTLNYENNPTEAEEIPQMDDEPEESGTPEQVDIEVPKVPGVSEQETINALEAYQKFHDFAPTKIEELDIPHPKIIARLGDCTATGYFSPKWKFKRKLKQRRGRNKGQHYIHEYQDTQNDADSMVGFAPDSTGDTGLMMAWRRCRLTKHGLEDLR
jgi:hypothetical protein